MFSIGSRSQDYVKNTLGRAQTGGEHERAGEREDTLAGGGRPLGWEDVLGICRGYGMSRVGGRSGGQVGGHERGERALH